MLLWILFILLEVARNYYLIEVKKERPNYLLSFILRGWAWIAVGIYLNVNADNWFTYMVMATTSFTLLFDPLLNATRKLPFDYLGKTSGWIDRFLVKAKWRFWVFEISALIACIVSSIIWYGNN